MVHGVNGVLLRRLPVGGGVGNDVASHYHIDGPPCKYLLQPLQIRRIGDIDWNIVGEQVHMELVRHRHIDNLAADQVRLRLLGPGKLVHSQINLVAQIPDLTDDSLVGEGKRVERTWEESHLLPLLNLHLANG